MASGYDLSSRHPFRLMQGRLGIYDKQPFISSSIDGVQNQQVRLGVHGGSKQQERMIKDKRRSLDHALWNSYQGADVRLIDADLQTPVRALINPNKLKQDYDDKIISIGYEYNFQCGDVFEWVNTNTHWLIYLQDLTELAYFRGDIRKCSYLIEWFDENGKYSSYAAVRGPVETKINYIQKHGISVDTPNHSLNILMPLTDAAVKYFRRYAKFYLQNDHPEAPQICWRVEAIDWISTPGILEINAVEYYANETEDDVQNGLVGNLIVKPENPNTDLVNSSIVGEVFIKPKRKYEYVIEGIKEGHWEIDSKYPVTYTVNPYNNRKIELTWTVSYSGSFELKFGDCVKTIVVESLF